tara:strand:- start:580 stop:879 length:300 start_codon:yes stop_codon:yes gene_type:complete
MSETSTKPIEILKEEIKQLKFNEKDVLTSKLDIAKRKADLNRASALGAQSKSNIKIYFIDQKGVNYKVIATVWATTEKNVSLKNEIMVPIKSIYKVGFF